MEIAIKNKNSKGKDFLKGFFSRGTIYSFLRAILLLGISYIILLPLLSKFAGSFMSVRDLYDQTVKWIPRNFTLEHYEMVWRNMNYPVAFKNTFLLTLTVSVLQLASCTVIGYGLARFDFKGKNIIFVLVILTLVVPPQMILTPLYLNFRFFDFLGILPKPLNLIGTYWPFIMTSITGNGLKNGLFIYIMRQFFRGMPKELEEAAYIDGAGLFRTFLYVMLPGAVPALVIVFLFAFVWQWNDYIFITLFMGGSGMFLPQVLELLATNVIREVTGGTAATKLQGDQFESLINNTGMLLVIAPLLLLYAFMQKYFIESVARSGIVG